MKGKEWVASGCWNQGWNQFTQHGFCLLLHVYSIYLSPRLVKFLNGILLNTFLRTLNEPHVLKD